MEAKNIHQQGANCPHPPGFINPGEEVTESSFLDDTGAHLGVVGDFPDPRFSSCLGQQLDPWVLPAPVRSRELPFAHRGAVGRQDPPDGSVPLQEP